MLIEGGGERESTDAGKNQRLVLATILSTGIQEGTCRPLGIEKKKKEEKATDNNACPLLFPNSALVVAPVAKLRGEKKRGGETPGVPEYAFAP